MLIEQDGFAQVGRHRFLKNTEEQFLGRRRGRSLGFLDLAAE